MRKSIPIATIFKRIELPGATGMAQGMMGAFAIITPNIILRAISSGPVTSSFHRGWEHVSVSTETRCPTWEEMNYIKNVFWDDEEMVVQFHPPKSKYVNNHPFVLHLWKSQQNIKLPPQEFV
jgi:hypothetical protein